MKIGDFVSFQAGLDRHIEFGILVEVDPQQETCVIECCGERKTRVLGRVRTLARGLKEQAAREIRKGTP